MLRVEVPKKSITLNNLTNLSDVYRYSNYLNNWVLRIRVIVIIVQVWGKCARYLDPGAVPCSATEKLCQATWTLLELLEWTLHARETVGQTYSFRYSPAF